MFLRILGVVPVSLLISIVLWRFFGPVDGWNLVQWILLSHSLPGIKMAAGALVFAVICGIGASLVLFAKKTPLGFTVVLAIALGAAYLIALGSKVSGAPMHIVYFLMLTISMTASWPMLFSDLVKGKTTDTADTTDKDR
jgi:hypothetical protein